MPLDRVAIKRRIAQARDEAGLTQAELGDLMVPAVHWRTVQNWESPSDPVTPFKQLANIARATGRSEDWLLHGVDVGAGAIGAQPQRTPIALLSEYVRWLAEDPARARVSASDIRRVVAELRAEAANDLALADRLEALLESSAGD